MPPTNPGMPQRYGPTGPQAGQPNGFPYYAGGYPSATPAAQIFPNYAVNGAGTSVPYSNGPGPQAHAASMFGPTGPDTDAVAPMPASPYGQDGTVISRTSPMEAAACQDCGDTCAPCAPCAAAPCCPWFGGGAGLFMGRDRPNKFWTSADGNNPSNQLLNTNDIGNQFKGGGEVSFGRYFGGPAVGIGGAALGGCGNCCGGYAVQATYWALSPLSGFASVNAPSPADGLVTPIILNAPPVPTIGPNNASDYFDGALRHDLWRRDYLQNIEVNFWRLPLFTPTQRCQVNWMAGVRYLRFTDDLVFGAVSGSTTVPSIFGTEAFLDTKMVNNLIGVQTGARGNYFLTRTVSLYAQPVFGLFGNHATSMMHLFDQAGNQGFDNRGRLNDVALLGQLDLGTQWFLTPRWSLFVAYRVIGITGVALADNQIPIYLNDTPAIRDVHSNGSLIVSGGVFGSWFAF